MNHTNKKNLLNASMIVAFSLGLAACGGHEHEVHAVDKVDEAAKIARANAPEPEIVELPETQAMPDEEATATMDETEIDGAEVDEAVVDEAATDTLVDTDELTPEVSVTTEPDTETAATPELSATAGKELYESTCHVCHESGLLGAPKLGDTTAWTPRIAQGIDILHTHSAEGYKQMPPQATGDVSKEQVYAAVDYMVAQSS